jgi:hypothetical protein
MKSNYFNATKIVEVILNDAIKTFDVTIRINGETYHVPTTYNVVDDAINLNFAELPELPDKEYQVICDKITDAVIDERKEPQEEIKHFYKGLKFFDDALKESKNIPTPTESELKETTLRMILEKVDASDLELFRWYLSLKEPSLSDISMAIEQLNDYHNF